MPIEFTLQDGDGGIDVTVQGGGIPTHGASDHAAEVLHDGDDFDGEGTSSLSNLQSVGTDDQSLGASSRFGHPRVPQLAPLDYPSRRIDRAETSLVADTETLADWSGGSGIGSLTADTTNYKTGTQAIKAETNGGGQGSVTYSPTLTVDLTEGPMEYWAYFEDFTNFERAGAFVFDSTGDYWRVDVWPDDLVEGWNRIPITISDKNSSPEVSGTPDETDINEIRIILTDDGTGSTAMTFDQTIQKFYSGNAKVIFRFDDATDGIWDTAKPVLDEYNFPGSIAVPTDFIGNSGYMTVEQLRTWQQEVGGVVSHQTATQQLDSISDADVEDVCYESQKWLLDNGFHRGARFLITHQNRMSLSAEEIAREYYANPLWMSTGEKYNALPETGVNRTIRFHSFDSHSVTDIKNAIDDLDAGSDAYHVIVWHEGDGATDLDDVVSYVDGKANVEPATYSDIFGQ